MRLRWPRCWPPGRRTPGPTEAADRRNLSVDTFKIRLPRADEAVAGVFTDAISVDELPGT